MTTIVILLISRRRRSIGNFFFHERKAVFVSIYSKKNSSTTSYTKSSQFGTLISLGKRDKSQKKRDSYFSKRQVAEHENVLQNSPISYVIILTRQLHMSVYMRKGIAYKYELHG